jgi:hypothetical protein
VTNSVPAVMNVAMGIAIDHLTGMNGAIGGLLLHA